MSAAHDEALAAWLASDDGKFWTDAAALAAPNDDASTLAILKKMVTRRAEHAFAAGWDACHMATEAAINDFRINVNPEEKLMEAVQEVGDRTE